MFRLSFLFLFFIGNLVAQDSIAIKRILSFQEQLNKEFASEEESPLQAEDLDHFTSLDFFEIDTSFCVSAKFVRTPYETPFVMKTTTGREPLYVKYAEAHFVLEGKKWKLDIYQNQGLKTQPEYQDYLFLPFTDATNGESSYRGGRFIDLKIPKGKSILIDFNTAYNPFCAYNDRYSCPIPPEGNHLNIRIPVGVKKYSKELANN
ncbi:DUF1684 domain-containing protein [Aquimarina sp. 2201CG1-2-11]|uniref:DUF1684 domain-containing protein n=1 Tax=Aquimarina discodermiae TaxID=3231043 RepID=UPI0034635EE4